MSPERSLKVLGMVSRLLLQGGDVQDLLRGALDLMAEAVGADRGLIFLVGEGGRLRAVLNMPDRPVSLDTEDYSTGVLQRAIDRARPVLVADVRRDTWASGLESVRDLGMTSLLVVPILSNTVPLGAVYLDVRTEGKRFTPEDEDLLLTFAGLIAAPLQQAAALRARTEEVARLRDVVRCGLEELEKRYRFGAMIGRSPVMRRVYQTIERVASSRYPVILEGETGTGKELAAKAIHFNGVRKDRPFLPVNCGAVSETLLESHLFGHVRGAFTGAGEDHAGFFQAADGGTLFLDEIEEMSEAMQIKLLRVLEDTRVWPVGGREAIPVDVRTLAATNRDIRAAVEEGRFRRDLYYRLSTFTIRIPPLRERAEDIPLLVDHFLEEIGAETGPSIRKVDRRALALFVRYPWPGNVRELRNELRKLSVLVEGEIRAADLPQHIREWSGSPGEDTTLRGKLGELDRKLILEALKHSEGNLSRAAERLGINRNTLKTRMRKHGIRRTRSGFVEM